MVRLTVPVTDLRALRCACRGPCGAVSGEEPTPISAGAHRLERRDVKTKGDED